MTFSILPAYSATPATSTIPAMFVPQWQMYTPVLIFERFIKLLNSSNFTGLFHAEFGA